MFVKKYLSYMGQFNLSHCLFWLFFLILWSLYAPSVFASYLVHEEPSHRVYLQKIDPLDERFNSKEALSPLSSSSSKSEKQIKNKVNQIHRYELVFFLEAGWKTYWKHPGLAGIPLSFDILFGNIESIRWKYPFPKEFMMLGDLYLVGYEGSVSFPISIESPSTIEGEIRVNYSICEKICLRKSFTIHADQIRQASTLSDSSKLQANFHQIPQYLPVQRMISRWEDDRLIIDYSQTFPVIDEAYVYASSEVSIEKIDFHPEASQIQVTFADKDLSESLWSEKIFSLTLRSGDVFFEFPLMNQALPLHAAFCCASREEALTILEGEEVSGKNDKIWASYMMLFLGENSLLWMFFLAFLGGLILNVMPCVLPMIALKLGQMKISSQLSYVRQTSYTVLGIWGVLLSLGLLSYILQQLGHQMGWGFHYQSPMFILCIATLLLILACIQMEVLPIHNTFLADALHRQWSFLSPNKPWYHLMYGMGIALLATPCTAPFLTTAVAYTLTLDSLWKGSLIFSGIAWGLSTPYLLSMLFKSKTLKIVKSLSSQGRWLTYVYGVMLYLSSLWFFWVYAHQTSWIFILIFLIALHGVYFSLRRISWSWVFLAFVMMIVMHFGYGLFVKETLDLPNLEEESADEASLKPFTQERLDALIQDGNVVFVNMTATWCLLCKYNEGIVLSDSEVLESFEYLQVQRLEGDLTRSNPALQSFILNNGGVGVPFSALFYQDKSIFFKDILDKEVLLEHLLQIREQDFLRDR